MVKELDLSRLSSVLKGSESGPVVVPGRAAESKLYRLIESGSMPPDREGGSSGSAKGGHQSLDRNRSGERAGRSSREPGPQSARCDPGPAAPLHHLSWAAPSG